MESESINTFKLINQNLLNINDSRKFKNCMFFNKNNSYYWDGYNGGYKCGKFCSKHVMFVDSLCVLFWLQKKQ